MCFLRTVLFLLLMLVAISLVDSGKVRHRSGHRQAFKFMRSHGVGGSFGSRSASTTSSATPEDGGLWPSVFNVATKAVITVNATCGEGGREEFCRMSEGARGRCGVCDNFSQDPGKRHPIHYAIDGTNKWWQSPSLFYGQEFEFVTISIDLKQVYQVAYIIIKAANSPRPGSWILERSLDGTDYAAWQFFASNDKECVEKYGLPATRGKPRYSTDSEVICTTFYSRLTPMENGEIHISLVHGRPGANETSPELLEFTKARYVRIRLQGLRGSVEPLPRWLSQDIFRDKRLFYSIRDISIGGQCVCNGHAEHCRHNVASGHPECECAHHTCGPNCDRCCPLYNQRKWGAGSSRDARECRQCNCHGHAKSCYYDESIDRAGLSLDAHGKHRGGGVCENCSSHTTGTNCELCIRGYYRPPGTPPDAQVPCVKCPCDPLGSTGVCDVLDDVVLCECRPGYAGAQCEKCAAGYRGFPDCEICPCDSRGIIAGDDCEGECVCKANVEGKFCDRCKMGYFNLQGRNHEGCYPCFCSGVTTLCEAAVITPRTIETLDDWRICDLTVTTVEKATPDERNLLTVGNYEIQGVESYYWLAPRTYAGNKLECYGSELVFKEHWIVMRGDTSGKPTKGPNLIIVGANGARIAQGDELHTESNMTFRIRLTEENNWYHLPPNITDVVTGTSDDYYKGAGVTRKEFLAVLADVKHVMLRAKFHTDQIEAALEQAVIDLGGGLSGVVEKCSCPSGYTGLSCESCEYGYVRIVPANNVTEKLEPGGFCVKCDCNGHSETCDPDTGQCRCEHDTVGENCDRCTPGFYGNPLAGTPGDCKRCACPLLEEENNFSPSCQLDSFSLSNDDDEPGYVCTQCPRGFTGDHCEICDDGFFGLPTQPGGGCRPCSCGGNPCDRITGQCLGCRGNTEGWRCERCKAGYFGDPTTGSCQACLCDPIGSKSEACDNVTGKCECEERFVGRTCDRCLDGYGNMTAMCLPCACNSVGSKSEVCDSRTGLCDCQPGVEGFHCDACQHLHFGFSDGGCPMCNCNPRGSELATCDVKTGNCRCKPYYVGRICDKCQTGYWENPSSGCVKCQCDADGSHGSGCDQNTGRCSCRPGVGGARCDGCLPGYFGFSNRGCRKCDDCDKPGHMCDPDTGRCICPQFSFGETCSNCMPNTWGHEANRGCKPCACFEGSAKTQCDLKTGKCTCRIGYDGPKCGRCAHGYYGYPKCRRCNCDVSGTDSDKGRCSSDNICQCNNDGVCPCKENVVNPKCNKCKPGTFGLHFENPDGCTPCFCFGRSTACEDARLTWDQIRTNSTRTLLVTDHVTHKKAINHDTIAGTYGNVTVDHHEFRNWRARRLPLYWQMHEVFRGDRILSYGGYIRFKTDTFESNQPRKENFESHPLVKLKGNGLELHYRMLLPPLTGRHEVRLHESLWRKWPADQRVSREMLMIVLQNVTDIYIKATDSSSFRNLTLHEVTLDTAIEVKGNPPPLAKGVELCACPNEYNSTSCQNPSVGFFRDRPKSPTATITIDTIVGRAERCRCNGRSNVCDTETGRCVNCASNTDGFHCENCAQGFYGNPSKGCKPCPCPSPDQNFAVGCSADVCYCKPGYKGKKCDECAPGYYGNPRHKGGSCQPCNCNREGIRNDRCDPITGQCQCKPGITGRQCSQCVKPRHILESNACRPCDACAQRLLDHIDQMTSWLYHNTSHVQNGTVPPPWEKLDNLSEKYENLFDRYEKTEALITRTNLDEFDAKIRKLKKKYGDAGLLKLSNNSKDLLDKSVGALAEITKLKDKLDGLITTLKNFGKAHVDAKEALREATKLIGQITRQYEVIQGADERNADVFKKCAEVKDFVDDIISKSLVGQSAKLKEKLVKLTARFEELAGILGETQRKLGKTQTKNSKNKARIEDLADRIVVMKRDASVLADAIKANDELVKKTGAVLNATEANLGELKDNSGLQPLLVLLKEKEATISNNTKLLEDYLKKAADSANTLNVRIQGYISQLQLSDKEIDAVNASKAYSNIVNLIEEAERITGEAEDEYNNALDAIEPDERDSLLTNVSISEADSSRLHNRIEPLRKKHSEYTDRMMKLNLRINNLSNTLWDNGMKNRNQTILIQQLKDNTTNSEDINGIIDEAIKHSAKMKAVVRKTMDLNITSQYDLAKNFQKYLDLTSREKMQELQEQIKVTKELLRNVFVNNQTKMDVIRGHNEEYTGFYERRDNISAKLEMLKAKIQKSKEIADGIRVSLGGAECRRSYRLHDLQPSLVTTLDVTFQYNKAGAKTPSSLFYLAKDAASQFMNLRIVNDTLIFAWKLSGDEKQLRFGDLQNELYTVSIRRVSNRVKMALNGTEKEETGESDDTRIFNISSSDLAHVGYVPGANGSKGLPGCVHDIVFNDRKIGFWNFHDSNANCAGCIRRTTSSTTYDVRFNGEGYSLIRKDRKRNPAKISIRFWLKTFDENVLLFLAPHPDKAYMALTLEDGHIRYEIRYKNDSEPIILKTKEKYNDGRKVEIKMGKAYAGNLDKASLTVRGEGRDEEKIQKDRGVSKSEILKVKQVNYYFGGIPPDFYLTCSGCTETLHTHSSLLGDMSETLSETSYILLYATDENQQHYGVQLRDGELEFRKAWFQGEGYLEMQPRKLENHFGIAFVVRTSQNNAFLMQIENKAKWAVANGKIDVVLYGKKNTSLTSAQSINDDEYHLVELIKTSKDYVLKVDGKKKRSSKAESEKAAAGAFYIGGTPNSPSDRFDGEISDIIINNQLIKFNADTIRSFSKVKIGRGMPPKKPPSEPDEVIPNENLLRSRASPSDNMKDMQNTEGCNRAVNYSLEPNAAKFGDLPESFVKYFLKEAFWKENFLLELEFRTFYKNGVLLYAQSDRGHYNLVELKEGKVQVHVAGKRKKILSLPKKVDDGEWHQFLIQNKAMRRKRKLQLYLDGTKEKPKKIPQNRVSGDVYIGDIPRNIHHRLPKILGGSKLHPFRGCIRELKINDEPQGFVNHHQIGQCFPNIERGSYFRGDAYAIYDKFFKVTQHLEFNFEFRTTEHNGILLSVSTPNNSPALSLELQNGAVVMSVDMGNGVVSNVTNYLSEYALCNNRWHNVTALFSTELTVNVDGVSKSWVISEGGQMDEIEDPLYIGGLPDYAPGGTLKIRENFKGCIRNVRIGKSHADWTNMEELNNVSLNSCPVAS